MADFTLEAGLQVVAGGVDKFIRDVQGEVNKKKIDVPIRLGQNSIKTFVSSVRDELSKNNITAEFHAKQSDVNTFIREIQGSLNKGGKLSVPFIPDQHSVATFAQKLQSEINKQGVAVNVKVEYDQKETKLDSVKKQVEDTTKSFRELKDAIQQFYTQNTKRIGYAGAEDLKVIETRADAARAKIVDLGLSVEELSSHFRNGTLEEYLRGIDDLNLSDRQLEVVVKAVADGIQKETHAAGQAAEAARRKSEADQAAAEKARQKAEASEAAAVAAEAEAEAERIAKEEADKRARTFDSMAKSVTGFIKAFIGVQSAAQIIKSLYKNVLDLDKAISDLRIATGYNRNIVAVMVKEYSKLGQQLGVTTVDVTKAADSWLRQGYEAEQATALITASTMLAKLGQLDMSAATEYLTSTMKGYGIAVNDVASIVDRLSAVDLVSATSAGDLAEAMQKTAVTANQTGIPLEKLIGMIATISEVSQQSATNVGTAMKSMLARMVNIKAGMLADPETGEDLSNVEAALRGVGIALRDTNGDFRDLDSVLEETAAKWNTLTGLQRNAVSVALGGSRQQEYVRILMGYWDQVTNLTNVASNSAGTAEEKFVACTDTIEAKLNALKAAWQSLSDTVVNSKFIKGAIDFLTGIINLLDKIPGSITVISSALLGISTALVRKSFVENLKKQVTESGFYLKSLKSAFVVTGDQIKKVLITIVTFIKTHWVGLLISIGVAAIAAVAAVVIKNHKTIQEKYDESIKKYNESTQSLEENRKKLEEIGKQIETNEALKGTANWTTKIDEETSALHLEYLELKAITDELEAQAEIEKLETLKNYPGKYGTSEKVSYGVSEDFMLPLIVTELGVSYEKAEEYLEDAVSKNFFKSAKAQILLSGIGLNHTVDNVWVYEERDAERYVEAEISALNRLKTEMDTAVEEGLVDSEDKIAAYNTQKSKLFSMASEYLRGFREYEELYKNDLSEVDKSSEAYKTYESLIRRYNMIEEALGHSDQWYNGWQASKPTSGTGSQSGSTLTLNLTKEEDAAVKAHKAYLAIRKTLNEDASLVHEVEMSPEDFQKNVDTLIEYYGEPVRELFEEWNTFDAEGERNRSSRSLTNALERTIEDIDEASRIAAKSGGLKEVVKDFLSLDGGEFDSDADADAAIEKAKEDIEAIEDLNEESRAAMLAIVDNGDYIYTDDAGKEAYYTALIKAFTLDDDAVHYIQRSWEDGAEVVEEATLTSKELFEKFEGYVSDLESAADPNAINTAKENIKSLFADEFGEDSATYAGLSALVDQIGVAGYTVANFKNDIANIAKDTDWSQFVNFDWLDTATVDGKVSEFERAADEFEKATDKFHQQQAANEMRSVMAWMFGEHSGVYSFIDALISNLEAAPDKIDDFRGAIYEIVEAAAAENEELKPLLDSLDTSWKRITTTPTTKDAFNALKEVFDADWQVDKDSAITALTSLLANMEGVGTENANALKEMLETANLATDKGSIIDMIISFLQGSEIEGAMELIDKLLELRDATPEKKNRAELADDFISAVGKFDESGSKYNKSVSRNAIQSAAAGFFGAKSEEFAQIKDWLYSLQHENMTLEQFMGNVYELTNGTEYEYFIPPKWEKQIPEVSEQMQGLASSLNSLMSQGSDAQRNDVFEKIKEDMKGIAGLEPEMRSALENAMQAFLDSGDEDAFKAAIVEAFSGDEAMQQYILYSWLPEAKTVKQSEAIKDVISDINSLAKEDTQQGRDEYYDSITKTLALLGVTAENTAEIGLFEFLEALRMGTLDGEEFEKQLYAIAAALQVTGFLSDQEQPESMESRIATAMGGQYGVPSYSQDFISAKDSLMGLGVGDMITSDEQAVILQQLPMLTDEFREYAAVVSDSTKSDFEKAAALMNLQTAFLGLLSMDDADTFRGTIEDLVDGLEDVDDGTERYLQGIQSIADAYGISTDAAREHFDELHDAIDGGTDSWHDFVQAASKDILFDVIGEGDIDIDKLMSGLYTVQDVMDATGWDADTLHQKLIANGLFEEVPNEIAGKISIPPFDIPFFGGKGLHFPGIEEDTVIDQPLLKPTDAFDGKTGGDGKKKRGGGGKKTPKSGKTSILSEQYTNDKGLYDTMIDNLKNLNNLYEEGSEEWLANQQRIIETYQAYAKTIQDEYDRLTKAGVSMIDSEMQTLSKDLLKVNKELYDASKEYWEAVRDNQIETMEHIVSQMDAVLDLRDAHKDLLTELRQENRELEKQYRIAQDEAAHPGLTDAERDMLFSSEDYKRLTGMLRDISEQADKLYEDYRNKIASVTEDETYAVEYITDEYERQLGLLESQYEVAKQQLAVEKARQELQNTLRERNTAVLINGTWTWMADPDAVQSAMENVADAEIELEDAITDMDYQRETAEIETARDAIKSSIDAMEALEFAIEDLADGIVDLADAINENIFNAIGTTSRKYLEEARGNGLELFRDELTELQETSGLIFANSDVERLYSLLSSGNTLNASSIFDSSIVRDSAAVSSILSASNSTVGGTTNQIFINGIQLNDADSELLLNALNRVAYTWQA